MKVKGFWSAAGAAAVAILASSCCWLPLLLLAVGAGTAAVGAVTNLVEQLRPLLAIAAAALLGTAIYLTYFRRTRPSAAGSAETCCVPGSESEGKEPICSCCGQKGKRVSSSTVRALVGQHLRGEVLEGNYILCLNPGCAQVYTGPDGARPFVKSDLAVRVGYKEERAPHLVCYCFEHSVEDIERELRASDRTIIPERIKAEVQAERCACDVKNPQGTCCLGNVNRAVKEARERIAGRLEAALGAPAVQCAPPPRLEEAHNDCCRLPRRSGAIRRAKRLNKVFLPIVSVLILGMIFFPHQIFAFLTRTEERPAANVAADSSHRVVTLSVPGMT